MFAFLSSIFAEGATEADNNLQILHVGPKVVRPLEMVVLSRPAELTVRDSEGRVYFRGNADRFRVGGALGEHRIESGGQALTFKVDVETSLQEDSGEFESLLRVCRTTMRAMGPSMGGSAKYRDRRYAWFVPWILDHGHVAKGARYFSPNSGGLVELFAHAQRADGMVWSFVRPDTGPDYFLDAYQPYGYAKQEGGAMLVRQPVENHNEYMFVNSMYLAWQSAGDDSWLREVIDSGIRALDYSVTDRARWSTKYQLLKRAYTVDSWDFQIDDGHMVRFPLGSEQLIDPDRTKFGVFFGDNHGYATACEELATMLEQLGRPEAPRFRTRAAEIRQRLTALAWNGKFYRHWVPEDESVKRDLGVDERSQLAMSNAYALNRGVDSGQASAILHTYQDLRANLPRKSPGEWYAIYPPYERGLGGDNEKWQYMNAGVHGHAAGELARGAFAHGEEAYGVDILRRLNALGTAHDGRLRFAYTGAIEPPPPAPTFVPVDLEGVLNMDLISDGSRPWMGGDPGNDLAQLPTGDQTFAGMPFRIAGAVAVSAGSAPRAEIPIGRTARALYLLHTVAGTNGLTDPKVVGTVMFRYADGTEEGVYLEAGRHVAGWWYPQLSGPDAGIAWRGPNRRTGDVGVSWAAIANPHPEKVIERLTVAAPLAKGVTYALLGLTLADRMPYHEPSPLSDGGPDNWTGGTVTAALIEGLVGVRDTSSGMREVEISPRWPAAGVSTATVAVRYGGFPGYVAYRYEAGDQRIDLTLTGSGDRARIRILLPSTAPVRVQTTLNEEPEEWSTETIQGSRYVVGDVKLGGVRELSVRW